MPENMTIEGLMLTVGIILAAMNLYNVFATARKNAREEKKRQAEPTVTLEGEITGINKKLGMDKLRLDEHEKRLADLRNGLMASCAGVQALLEHELHNGNADEMQSASKEINTWLRERP